MSLSEKDLERILDETAIMDPYRADLTVGLLVGEVRRLRRMKLYSARFPGSWIGADAVVLADSEEGARDLILAERGHLTGRDAVTAEDIHLSEIPLVKGFTLINDGDY